MKYSVDIVDFLKALIKSLRTGKNKNLEFYKLMHISRIFTTSCKFKNCFSFQLFRSKFGVLNDLLIKQHKEFFYHTLEEILIDYKDGFLKFNPKKVMLNDILNYLPDNILSAFDKATMLNSIEGRVPYLDHLLAETLLSNDLGKNYFDSFSNNKRLLRNI